MILEIKIEPNKILRQVGKKLTSQEVLNSDTQKLIKDMIETMNPQDGAGIAAPRSSAA